MSGFFRLVTLSVLFFLVAACSQSAQTGVSTYSAPNTLAVEQREAKIQAARERARKAKAERRESFKKAREARAKARKERREARSGKRPVTKSDLKKTTKRKTSKSRAKSKRLAKRNLKKFKASSIKVPKGKSYGITLNDPWKCVPGRLKNVIRTIAKRYGRVVVNSTHRSPLHNRRVGGKRNSYHLKCRAIDFNVYGNTRGLSRWLRNHPHVGGFKRYKSGYFHIDNGPRRTW